MGKMNIDKMGADKTSGFTSHIPRSIRTDNLAKIIKMGASSKKKAVSKDNAFHSDYYTLGQLARLYKPGNGTRESLAEEFNIALETPVPDDNEPLFGLVADHSFASSDSGFITEDDFADTSNMDISFAEENHYDPLEKRSPAVLNPFYFDAVRISPSHGSGSGSARYNESGGSINNLRLDFFNDVDSELATITESAKWGSAPTRNPECLTFGIAGGAIALKRVQILDLLMPDPGVLAELENADVREGKDSPFRSYYGHQPVLFDIQEETKPENDYGPRVLAYSVKNRHQGRSRGDSVAKMKSSTHARSPRASDAGSKAPSCCRPSRSVESPISRCSKRFSDGSRGQDSSNISGGILNLGSQTAPESLASITQKDEDDDWETESDNAGESTCGDISALGFHTVHGSWPSIEQEKQKNDWWETGTDNSDGLSLFVAIKEPAPGVSVAFSPVEGNEMPLPFDFTTSDVQPLSITPEEQNRLFDEPKFVMDGRIPQDYIRFATSPAMSTPTNIWEPHRPDYPLRGSSLNATPCKGDAIFLGCPTTVKRKFNQGSTGRKSEHKDELANIFRKIREDFSNTALGKMADAYLSHALLSNVDQAIALAFNYELGVKGCPSIELLASAKVFYTIIGYVKHAGDEVHRSGNSKKAVELYDDIGGKDFVQKELDTVSAVVTKCLAQSPMVVLDKGVISEGISAETTEGDDNDPFTDRPRDASNDQSGSNPPQSIDPNHAAWAQSILGSTLDGVAIAPFEFSSLASSRITGSATLRGNIRGKECLHLNNPLRPRSLFRFTGVGSIAPGTPVGEASRYPLPYVYYPFDGTFGLIDEIVVGIAYTADNGSSSSSSSSVELNPTVDEIAADPVVQLPYAGPNVFAGQGGAAVVPHEVANSATNAADAARDVHTDTIDTADSTSLVSTTPRRKPGGYNLFPADASAPCTPSQAAERERKKSQDKPLPAIGTPASYTRSLGVRSILSRVPSISKKKKTDGSQGLLASLNKPLPAIANDDDAIVPARAAAINTDVSPNFSDLSGLERTPAEKKQLGSMRRYGSKAIDTLRCLWSKSDQELAANQASDRERRKKTADRVINMARDYDESRAAFPQPAAGVMIGMQAEEQSPTLAQSDAQRVMVMQAEVPILSSKARQTTGTDIEECPRGAREIYLHSPKTDPVAAQNSGAASTPLRTGRAAEKNAGSRSRISIPLSGNVACPAARTPSRIPIPAHRTSAFTEGVENVVPGASTTPGTPAISVPKRRGARDAIVSAMGFGSRRKSIGENTRVNGA